MLLSAEWMSYWLDVYEGKYDKPARHYRVITKFRIQEIELEPSGFKTGIEVLEAHYV